MSNPRRAILACGILMLAGAICHGAWAETQLADSSAEPSQTTASRADDAFLLRIVYAVPANRSPQPEAEAILGAYVIRAQGWFREQMKRMGYRAKSFRYESGDDGSTPKVHLLALPENDTWYHGTRAEQWVSILRALREAGFAPFRRGELKLVIAETQLQRDSGEFLRRSSFLGGAATNDAGLALATGETFARLPEELTLDDSSYEGMILTAAGTEPLVVGLSFREFEGSTLSSISSSAQGGLLHELGHAMGLPHEYANDSNLNGNLMGNGFRGIRGSFFPKRFPADEARLTSASARLLDLNPFFNRRRSSTDRTPPEVEISDTGTAQVAEGHCLIEFSATDQDSPLRAALLLRNGQVAADIDLRGRSVRDTLRTWNYRPGIEQDWKIVVVDAAGNRGESASVRKTCQEGFNRAPRPFVQVTPTLVRAGQRVTLNARKSTDPDGNNTALSVRWDFDGDGVLDTASSTSLKRTIRYPDPGLYQVIARITDEAGDSSYSVPIGIRVRKAKQSAD